MGQANHRHGGGRTVPQGGWRTRPGHRLDDEGRVSRGHPAGLHGVDRATTDGGAGVKTDGLELKRLRADIHRDFVKACGSLYWINPRAGSNEDPDDPLRDPTKPVKAVDDDEDDGGLRLFELWSEQKLMADV